LLAEIAAQLLESQGHQVERRFGMGGTLICYQALVNDEIDLYMEYTGTLSQVILDLGREAELNELNDLLASRSLAIGPPLGFNNTYAMVVKRSVAEARKLFNLADLNLHPDLKVVVSHEFLERADGWPGLAATYGLAGTPTGIEHGLAYQALDEGVIDVTDAYSTDGELERYDLVTLTDDQNYFPVYLAVPLVRADLPEEVTTLLASLENSIDDQQMSALNYQVVFNKRSFADVASEFLASRGVHTEIARYPIVDELIRNTIQHLKLTSIALLAAVLVGVGLSLAIFRRPGLSRAVTYICGLMQTIPSIALLALMIPIFGIGALPAIIALFLYSLLPILRNTVTALTTIDPTLTRVGVAIGLTQLEQLKYVYVPLSLPSMLAGIRTAAVISIGTATLAAFIGAGGLGDPIVTGLSLNDMNLVLRGALPAAALAVLTELLFEAIEHKLLPGHLRLTT
ncbi:MAG: ABC transporter permease subunit, partial [Proteobacteria bacterium]|nr:ABC transporter permease subunit [Pseudomonadota bacterium]